VEGAVAEGTDGFICIAAGIRTITIPLDNSQGYDLDISLSVAALPSGASATAWQSEDKNAIEILMIAAEEAEFTLPLTVKTAKEGRILAVRDLKIACVSFEANLSALTVPGYAFTTAWDPARVVYAVDDVPGSSVKVMAEALNSQAQVSITAPDYVVDGPGMAEADVFLPYGATTDITILVKAPHGVKNREYTLHITRLNQGDTSSSKNIMAFIVGEVTATAANGSINEAAGDITVTLPYGTNLTNLTPELVHTGASYTPTGARDFSNSNVTPVVYTVTAQDGSAKTYAVTVQAAVEPVEPGRITSFTVAGATATEANGGINEAAGTISVTVPFGTVLTNLSPAISWTGASCSPDPWQAQDFTSPVLYTVAAADGSAKIYVVTVQAEAPSVGNGDRTVAL
jgi:hypothetical protein